MSLPQMNDFSAAQMLPYKGSFDPYKCTDNEIEELFLFTSRRKSLWLNFLQWRTEIRQLFGDAVFWINGSFVTIKPDPNDIDVVAIVSKDSYLEGFQRDSSKFLSLKTTERKNFDGSNIRVQPYGGLIDSFIVPCDNIDTHDAILKYWDDCWSTVNSSKGYLHTSNKQKGYLEVR